MKKFNHILLIILFMLFITFFGLIIWVKPDKEISEVESRPLAQQPDPQVETILNGEFTKQFQDYITDQFYLRDNWVKGYLQWQIISDQTFVHDYHIEGDWVYPKPFYTIDEPVIRFAANQVRELNEYAKAKDIELYFFSLPDRRHMLGFDFPKSIGNGVGQADKEMFFSLLPKEHLHVVDVGDKWERDDYRDFYYRTDHHWNMNGAFAAYEVIRNTLAQNSIQLDVSPLNKGEYTKNCINDKTFMGVYNKQLFGMINPNGEEMCYFESDNMDTDEWIAYTYGFEEANQREFSNIYGVARHSEMETVSYAEVYAGDYNELHVVNPAKEAEGSKVLILKDSYANPLLPLIAEQFYQTTYYDVRHNKDRNLYAFIEKHEFDAVVFLYSNGRTVEELYLWSGPNN